MKAKCLITIIMVLIMIPIVYGVCCERGRDCIVTETCQDGLCGNVTIQIFNRDGSVNITWQDMLEVTQFTYTYNMSRNLSVFGTYPYVINSTSTKVCKGSCEIELKDYCEVEENMILSITLFLLGFNVLVFLLPFFLKLRDSKVQSYILKRMLWIASVLFLWFNMTLYRELSISYGLGIDNYLLAYWWVFTVAVFMCVFLMVYFGLIGLLRLLKTAQMKRRMGEAHEEHDNSEHR